MSGRIGVDEIPESTGVGWTPGGKAIVQFRAGACGAGLGEPGIYTVDPMSFERTMVRSASEGASQVRPWYREAN